MDWKGILKTIVEWVSTSGIKLIIGAVVLFVLFKITNKIVRKFKKSLEKRHVDHTITNVTCSILSKVLKLMYIIIFLGYVGIDTAAIGTVIGSVGLAIGLSLQGSLANFAGGIVILVMRPFRIDDYIEAQGVEGTVEDIKMFYTYIVTPSNQVVMVPNGVLANGTIKNYSMKDLRRLDLTFSISYSDDFEKAKRVIGDICKANQLILNEPAPFIKVSAHSSSSIDILTRVWVNRADYWTVNFQMLEDVKKRFDEENISIPFPQLDVHLDKNK